MKIEINKEDRDEMTLDALSVIAESFSNLEESQTSEGHKYYLEDIDYNGFLNLMNLLSNKLRFDINVANVAYHPNTIYLTIK